MAIEIGIDNPDRRKQLKKVGIIAGGVFALAIAAGWFFSSVKPDFTNVCVQYDKIVPQHGFTDSSVFKDPRYAKYSAQVLAGAIQIPTVSYDDMDLDVTKEKRFKIFKELHQYLEEQFPLAYEYRETINEYGLLYTFPGSDKHLKPIVLMAHQDVVPVNPSTEDQWDHDPFSGKFDGEWIYGRGSSDTKNSLVAQLEAVESLLQQRWTPKRTVILSFGFDEEIEGHRGAQHLSAEILKRYGKHGVEAIVDEGFGISNFNNQTFAMPAVAEKGRVDFNIELLTPGGHSSMPPPHTGIGILAQLANTLEENPFTPEIAEGSILTETFGCVGRWTENLPYTERVVLGGLQHGSNRKTLAKALQKDPQQRWLVRTTQAIDLFNGGVKVNALPEKTVMQVDHRIAIHQSVDDLKDRLAEYAKELAEKFDLNFEFNGHVHRKSGHGGTLNITSFGAIDPAPVSSTSNKAWKIISGTTKHVFEDVLASDAVSENVYMAPVVMTANTDTAHYWDVSKSIYRYNPVLIEDMVDFHTVNEKLRFRSHISCVAWFYEYIINFSVE